ncbi:2'-5' RNA ligase family protein [Desertivirga brevis]|uniref:2'-5' RNA ligase family protein n=1 Tax=Desertivirga brevis TaxID=2810310 RepID=UPI001A97CDD2|nr:2'-5' RNA ligase family protein [Pedobacter sp. SYSU D00873]
MLEQEHASYFTSLRDHYFPVERNYLKAHITLFHHLPDTIELMEDLEQLTTKQPFFSIRTNGFLFLGNGFAIKVESTELQQVHSALQQKWWASLTNQDKQKLRPHITIQNKVLPDQARISMNELETVFEDRIVPSMGLALWEYLGGPWKLKREFKWGRLRP